MSGLLWQPVVPAAVLLVFGVVAVGFAAWRIIAERDDRALFVAWIRRALLVALLLVIAARPGLAGGSSPASVAQLNVFFVVDTTSSAAAEDWNGDQPRLVGMRADIKSITEELAGARFSLLTFDSTAIQRVPLTDDASAVVSAAAVMRQEITYYSHGSSISEANTLLQNRLAAARKSDPGRANLVYYLGDGEQTSDQAPGSFGPARASTDGGGVLGYGTEKGGRMKEFDGYGDQYSDNRYIKDKTRAGSPDALSHIDQTALRQIASQLGVPYLHRVAGGSLSSVVDSAKRGQIISSSSRTASVTDLYWIPAIPFFGLLFVEIAVVGRALLAVRPARQEQAGRPQRGGLRPGPREGRP